MGAAGTGSVVAGSECPLGAPKAVLPRVRGAEGRPWVLFLRGAPGGSHGASAALIALIIPGNPARGTWGEKVENGEKKGENGFVGGN